MTKEYFSLQTKWELGKEVNGNTPFKCYVAYPDENRKKINIPKQVFEDGFQTAVGIPVVAHFFSDGKLAGHEDDLVKIGFETRMTGKTHAYGVTRFDSLPYWEKREDGKDWVCMEGFVFTKRFPESKAILSSNQSMEVKLSFSENEKSHIANKIDFLALCSLNPKGIEPTFEDSKFVTFSGVDAYWDDTIEEYYDKMKQLFNDEEISIMKPSEKIKFPTIKTVDELIKWLEENDIELSDEDKEELSEDYDFAIPEKYKHINFKPPASVAKEAKKGLELRNKQPESNKCCTSVGLARARQLVNRQELSPNTIKRMKAYFDRHEVDKQGEGWGEDSKGYQAWLHWGDDAGYTWAKKIVAQMDKVDEKFAFSDNKENVEIVTNKDEVIEGIVGEKDLGEIKRVAMNAKNYKIIIPKIFAKYPSEIDENITQSDLGYPLMSLKDGKFYYNTGFIKAASSRIEQNKEEPYYKEVRANIVNARKHIGMPEEFKKEDDDMPEETNFAMSMENTRAKLRDVLQESMGTDDWFYVRDFDDAYVYISCDGGIFRYDYAKGEENKLSVDLNTKAKVTEMTHYVVEGEEVKMSLDEDDVEKEDDTEEVKEKVEDVESNNYAEEIETLKATLKEKETMLEEFAKEKKVLEFAKILDNEDFSMLTDDDKKSLMSLETDVEEFTKSAESMAFKRVKESGLYAKKEQNMFSIGIPKTNVIEDETPKSNIEMVKKYLEEK